MAQTTNDLLDLATINAVEVVLQRKVKDRVCKLESDEQVALDNDCHEYSKQLRHAARELELFRHDLSSALTHLFIEALRQRELQRPAPSVSAVEVIKPTPEVSLPEIPVAHKTVTSQR